MASIQKTLFFFPENYLRHIDSGDISLVNGKTEGIDGMIKTTFPLLHDFLFLFSECLICFALKNCSGMNECMIRCSYQINVLTCQTVSHSLVKSILLSTFSRYYKRLAYDFWNHSKGWSSMPSLTFRNCNFWHLKDINLTKSQKLFLSDAKNQQIENPKYWWNINNNKKSTVYSLCIFCDICIIWLAFKNW